MWYWVQGWGSGESARLPPMWPRFDTGPVPYVGRVEFVVGSHPRSEYFSLGSPDSFWKQWTKSLSMGYATANSFFIFFKFLMLSSAMLSPNFVTTSESVIYESNLNIF